MGLYSIGRNRLNLIYMNAVSHQLIKVGLEMLTEPKKPKRKMVAKTKQRRPRVVGRARKQLAARQRTGRHSTPGRTPLYTRLNVSTQRGTTFYTRENTRVHQIEVDNMQHTKALHQTALQTNVQETVHKETSARQRTPSLP